MIIYKVNYYFYLISFYNLNNNQKQSNIKVNNDEIIMKYKKEINDLKYFYI